MNLFDNQIEKNYNLLPYDGIVNYFGKIISFSEANRYFQLLWQKIDWQHDEVIIFGKPFITKRKVAWYGDEPYEYTYSRSTKKALFWTDELLALKKLVEFHSHHTFNSCLLNLYHNGEEGMSWHSDDEKMLEKNAAIASLSFGAERKFLFRHKHTKETISLHLENGSLLIMKGLTQTYWNHSLPKSKKIVQPRINLTFRKMI
ncbi:MAG: alpha-ketoglutarate-dependent dioxygenase AlkB [Flammeovirgaceae bacterium]